MTDLARKQLLTWWLMKLRDRQLVKHMYRKIMQDINDHEARHERSINYARRVVEITYGPKKQGKLRWIGDRNWFRIRIEAEVIRRRERSRMRVTMCSSDQSPWFERTSFRGVIELMKIGGRLWLETVPQ